MRNDTVLWAVPYKSVYVGNVFAVPTNAGYRGSFAPFHMWKLRRFEVEAETLARLSDLIVDGVKLQFMGGGK